MRVRFNNAKEFTYTGQEIVTPLVLNEDVVIVCDPSKSNFAMLIGSPYREQIYAIYEFSGNDNRYYSSPISTGKYCNEVDSFLKQLIDFQRVQNIYIEEHIIAKGQFTSNTVLIEIQGCIEQLAEDQIGKVPIRINNMVWKKSILPDRYRGRNDKGSLRYWREQDSARWGNVTDDVTDVYSIYLHVLKAYKSELPSCKYLGEDDIEYPGIAYLNCTDEIPSDFKQYRYNKELTLKQNINFLLFAEDKACIKITDNDITVEDVWAYAIYPEKVGRTTKQLYVFTERIKGGN